MQVSLLELQQNFCHALRSGNADDVAPWISGNVAAERLAIYRNNSQTNLRNALRSDYPVVEKLVGGEFFAHVADAYIASTPSHSGDVGDYGSSFADFLSAFPAAGSLHYLSDVARIERAWMDVFLAADTEPIDPAAVASLPQDKLGALCFGFNPGVYLLASANPVLSIWRANQADADDNSPINIDSHGEFILLRRIGANVELILIEHGEYTWLSRLQSGVVLSDAVEAAFTTQSDFDLTQCLHRHLAAGTFISFTLGETP